MVAGRHRELFRDQSSSDQKKYNHVDLENGNGAPPQPRQRFRDAIDTTINQSRAREMKKLLIENFDHKALEKFRKSDEEVSCVVEQSRNWR